MIAQALYLTSETHADPRILNLLRSHCAEVHVVSAVAQATALIFPSNLLSDSGSNVLIVADVAVGGLALAEYVLELSNRAARREQQTAPSRPRAKIILIDEAGDVNAARKALRLGVDEYLLASDSIETRTNILQALIAKMDNYTAGESRRDADLDLRAAAEGDLPTLLASNGAAHPFDANVQDNVRLSQIESAIINCLCAHVGSPLSARAIVNQVMGRDMDEDKAASFIRPHISRLRLKVEPTPQMPQRLLTVRGKGYMVVC